MFNAFLCVSCEFSLVKNLHGLCERSTDDCVDSVEYANLELSAELFIALYADFWIGGGVSLTVGSPAVSSFYKVYLRLKRIFASSVVLIIDLIVFITKSHFPMGRANLVNIPLRLSAD